MSGELKDKSVVIATPMFGGMCSGIYVQGLVQNITHLNNIGVQVLWTQLTNESLITRGRNELARIFLESDATHLMFIDADIGFAPDAVATLLKADCDMVCGVYPKKEVNWARVGEAAKEGKENLSDYAGAFVLNTVSGDPKESDERGVVEVRHGGTGFMLIAREVFDKLKPHVDTYRRSSVTNAEGEYVDALTHEFFATSIDHTGALLSEDYHFCDLWRKHGGKVHVNPFLQLSHVGSYMFQGNLMKSGGRIA